MNSDQWERVETLYHAALERDLDARANFLSQTCSDEQVRLEVAALLRYDTQAKSFIESVAVGAAARVLAAEAVSESIPPREIGPYRLLAPVGQGGMGEVHLALDTRLNRKVAIKLLPSAFTADSERAQRFKQEARAASALSHPNIVTVFEVGEADGRHYIVSEFVEGDTLRQLINSSQKQGLELRPALAIAAQIAGALEAAHRLGIIHRDIKPENVIVRKDGLVKVLDFGLAKLNGQESEDDTSQSQLLLTRTGMVMGTAAYMSPEQARGQRIDHRADIFSFGALAYEMLSGERPFAGATTSDVIAAVLIKDPQPLRKVAPRVTSAVSSIVGRCLEKLPEKRFQSAADLAFTLQDLSATSTKRSSVATNIAWLKQQIRQHKKYWVPITAAALVVFALAAVKLFTSRVERPPVAFNFSLPDGWAFRRSDVPAVSPDGEMIVVSAFPTNSRNGQASSPWIQRAESAPAQGVEGVSALWLRRVDLPEAKLVKGTDGASAPFWSPDSRYVAFWQESKLRKVDISSGSVSTVLESLSPSTDDSPSNFGIGPGAWSIKNVILLSVGGKLVRISGAGGSPIALGTFADGETGQFNPRFLPDGRNFLYYSRNKNKQDDGIYVASVDAAAQRKLVVRNASAATYVQVGYLLYGREGQLLAQQLDLSKFEVAGDARNVGIRLGNQTVGPIATFSASDNGVLVWRPLESENSAPPNATQLVWFDRSGKRMNSLGDPSAYSGPAFSPDEKQIAVAEVDPKTRGRDLWIIDVLSGGRTRFTADPSDEFNPLWTPDAKWIYFTAEKNGKRSIFRKAINGIGNSEEISVTYQESNIEDISSDGRFLIFNSRKASDDNPDLTVLALDGSRRLITFAASDAREDHATFSPDSRWVVYRSEQPGRSTIFVRGIAPNGTASAARWQISDKSGDQPRWSRDGKQLYYLEDNTLMVVDVDTKGSTIITSTPRPLFKMNLDGTPRRNRYLVSQDGQRFLAVSPAEATIGSTLNAQLNWPATLKTNVAEK